MSPFLHTRFLAPVFAGHAFQVRLGAGCQTAFAAHAAGSTLYFFHERTGRHQLPLTPADLRQPEATAERLLKNLGLPS